MTKHKYDKKNQSKDFDKKCEDKVEENKAKKQENIQEKGSDEISKLKDILARTQADFTNYKTRIERDRDDMIVFLKSDIFKTLLPRIDDLERIISQTPENQRDNGVYEGVKSIHKKIITDLEKMGVKSFDSIGNTLDPNIHEVMTQIPGKEGIILEEFEKGYMIGDKVLRVAKVVVGQS